MYKNGLVDEIYLNKNLYPAIIHSALTFEYCSLTSDHGWIMFLLILSRHFMGNFFLFPAECVLKAHPPTHVNKNKELSNEWKQH